jgi:peptide/nickel transport system substrate-binding protein
VTTRGRGPGFRRRLIGCTAAVAVLAAGCGAAGTSTTPVTYVGVRGGSISMGMDQSPTGCNPHTVSGDTPATRLILSGVLPSPYIVNPAGVVTPNPNLIVQGELVSAKPETIVYTLNPRAVWSDGVPITAADFKYAWIEQRAVPSTAPDSVASIEGYRDISSVTGTNRGRTVTVKFRTLYADWESLFANLLPAHIMERVGWTHSCSTVDPAIDLSGGPFSISSVSSGAITLRDNPKWWGIHPNAASITVHIAQTTEQLAQWMRSNYIQVALPSSVSESFLTQMASLPNAETSVQVSSTLLQLEMASGPNTPLSPDMRFAIALSIDRQAIVNQVADWVLPSIQVANSHIYVQGQSGYHSGPSVPPAGGTTSPTSTSTTLIGQGGNVNFPITPVPSQADGLMTASGFERTDGSPWHTDFGVPFTLHIVVDEGDPWAAATAPLVQSQLEAAGFAVSLYPTQSAATAGAILANGFADLALLPRTATPFLSQSLAWYTTALGTPGQNGSQDWSGFVSTPLTNLLLTASQQLTSDTAAATYAYAQADTLLWDDMVALPLFAEPSMLVWSRTVGGVLQTPQSDSLLWYAELWAVRTPESTNNTTPSLPGQ